VVESEEMEDGGLKVVDVDFVLGDVEAEVVGFAVGSGFGAATGHEGGEGLGMVVAAGFTAEGGFGFDHGGAAGFAAPNDEGFVEEAVAFEVLDEGGGGLGGLFAVVLGIAFDVGVGVPAGVVDVDEADAALDRRELRWVCKVGEGGCATPRLCSCAETKCLQWFWHEDGCEKLGTRD